MYGVNRAAEAPRASFRSAGGSRYFYGHPFLLGQIDGAPSSFEVEITKSLLLNSDFFDAEPLQPNAVPEVAVDGSLIIITNHVLAGVANIQVVPTTGLIKDGDLTEIPLFIMGNKDDIGGYIRRVKLVGGKAISTVYYDATFQNFPHDKDSGNRVPVYPIQVVYGGLFKGIFRSSENVVRHLWAIGNAKGFEGIYSAASLEQTKGTAGFDDVDAAEIPTMQTDNDLGGANYDNSGVDLTASPAGVFRPAP